MEKLSAMVLSKKKELDTKKKNKGFTLVELIIVIAIMVALVAILAPQYIKYVEKSRVAADQASIDEVLKSVKIAATDTTTPLAAGTYTCAVDTNGKVTLTNLTTTVTDAIGETSFTLKSSGAKTAAKTQISFTIAANTYETTCSLTSSTTGDTTTWTDSDAT